MTNGDEPGRDDHAPLVTIEDDIVMQHVVDETVLMNPSTGEYYGLNDTGRHMLDLARALPEVSAVVSAMTERYDVDEATAEQDLLALLTELAAERLVRVRPGVVGVSGEAPRR